MQLMRICLSLHSHEINDVNKLEAYDGHRRSPINTQSTGTLNCRWKSPYRTEQQHPVSVPWPHGLRISDGDFAFTLISSKGLTISEHSKRYNLQKRTLHKNKYIILCIHNTVIKFMKFHINDSLGWWQIRGWWDWAKKKKRTNGHGQQCGKLGGGRYKGTKWQWEKTQKRLNKKGFKIYIPTIRMKTKPRFVEQKDKAPCCHPWVTVLNMEMPPWRILVTEMKCLLFRPLLIRFFIACSQSFSG